MRIRKLASPLVTLHRRLYEDVLSGASLHHQRTLMAMTPHVAMLQGIGAPTSCSVLQEIKKFSIPRRNFRNFENSSVSFVSDCHRGGHSAGCIKSRFYSSAKNGGDPVPVGLSTSVDEDLFHDLADEVLHQLQEKIEILGEDQNVDGFDADYADGVLTVRLGRLGTYVINKQTPNRQIWLSSPVSGPARYEWIPSRKVWVYRRTSDELVSLLEKELSQLLNTSVRLS